jgi:hypothetical protein
MSFRFHIQIDAAEAEERTFWMIGEDDTRLVITPSREAKLFRAINEAWNDVRKDLARYSIWARTRACMMFERLAVRLQEAFIDDPDVRFEFANETVKITLDDEIVARVKKADGRGLGHNVQTETNDLFCDQADTFPGFEPLDKIEIVYVLNMYGTEINRVMVQARDGDVRLWAYQIDDTALGTAAPIQPLPSRPTPPSSADDLVQPRAKPIVKDESDKSK